MGYTRQTVSALEAVLVQRLDGVVKPDMQPHLIGAVAAGLALSDEALLHAAARLDRASKNSPILSELEAGVAPETITEIYRFWLDGPTGGVVDHMFAVQKLREAFAMRRFQLGYAAAHIVT